MIDGRLYKECGLLFRHTDLYYGLQMYSVCESLSANCILLLKSFIPRFLCHLSGRLIVKGKRTSLHAKDQPTFGELARSE
jgi:hypothetical protein